MSDLEAQRMQQRYLELLRRLSKASEGWPSCAQIDESPKGKIPRVNLSVKLSALCARFDPLDPNTETTVRARLRELFREAGRLGAAITVDMEQHAFKDLTLEIFRGVLEEDAFRERPHVAIALQAYLRDAESDVRELIRWAHETPPTHRCAPGERALTGTARSPGPSRKIWPIPVYLDKAETDASYERLTRLLLENHDMIDAAFGSHNVRSMAHAMVTAKSSACRRPLRVSDALRHGRAGPPGIVHMGSGSASICPLANCCRAWPISSAGCWRILPTLHSCARPSRKRTSRV